METTLTPTPTTPTIPPTVTPTPIEPSFVQINPSSGDGNSIIRVTCNSNNNTTTRTKVITIVGNGVTKTINVTQEAKSSVPNLYFVGAACSLNDNPPFNIDTEPPINSIVVYTSGIAPIITLRALSFPHGNDNFEISWNFNESDIMVYPDDTINFKEVTIVDKSVITKGVFQSGKNYSCTIKYQQKEFKIEVSN